MLEENKPKDILGKVMEGILEVADQKRKKSKAYKNLFSKTRGGGEKAIRSLIYETQRQMIDVALNCAAIFEQKTGKKMTDEQYEIITALPYVLDELTSDIEKKDGRSCCVDKAYHLIYEQFTK